MNRLTIPTNQQSFSAVQDEPVTTSVLRYRRDVGRGSTLGVLYTGREGDDYHNRVGGLDGFARFSGADTLRVQYLRSNTVYPGEIVNGPVLGRFAGTLEGDALRADYNHSRATGRGPSSTTTGIPNSAPTPASCHGWTPRSGRASSSASSGAREGRTGIRKSTPARGGGGWRTTRASSPTSGQSLRNVSGPLQSFVEVVAAE